MAQSEDADDADVDGAAACQMAMEAALEKGMEYCDTQESRLRVLGKIVGLDDAESIDTDAALDAGPADAIGSRQTREWIVARADEIIDTHAEDPLDAINEAWGDLATEQPDDEADDAPEEEAKEPPEEPPEPEAEEEAEADESDAESDDDGE